MDLNLSALERYLSRQSGAPVILDAVHVLGEETAGPAALKGMGYGRPLCIDYHCRGERRRAVLRSVRANGFGRERSADRAAAVWLDYATFNHLPGHVRARDLILLDGQGELSSMGRGQELLLLTDYAPGRPYAEDLVRIRDDGEASALDTQRAQALAGYLADIHTVREEAPLLWRRRLRDLIGHGEGIMGLTDSYRTDDPLVTPRELQALEEAANGWRWRLKPLGHRLCQVHGDFHPFNVLFGPGVEFQLLDRSRGEWGEAADDVSCMAVNYLFFSLQRWGRLADPFLSLYTAFWERYLEREDPELPAVIQPWFAWRALVLASLQWYPHSPESVRRALLTFARRVLNEERFQWREINRYLT